MKFRELLKKINIKDLTKVADMEKVFKDLIFHNYESGSSDGQAHLENIIERYLNDNQFLSKEDFKALIVIADENRQIYNKKQKEKIFKNEVLEGELKDKERNK